MSECKMAAKKPEMKPLLPNLVLSTTYALNKSNSKRMCIGLEYQGGSYRAVVKIVTSVASHRSVTFDVHDWEILKDQFEAIEAYFHNYYSFYQEFGKPNKIFLPEYVVKFTSSYGTKSIAIDERLVTDAQNLDEFYDDEECDEAGPSAKKSKRDFYNSRGIVMQQTTFEGMHAQRHCVDLLLASLKEKAYLANAAHSYILQYMEEDLKKENNKEDYKKILKDFKMFTLYYSLHLAQVETFVREKMSQDEDLKNLNYSDDLKLLMEEFLAYNLPLLFTDVRDIMLPKE